MRYILTFSILIIGGCATTTTTADKGQSNSVDAGVPAVVTETPEDELWRAYEEVCNNSTVNIMHRRGQHSRGGKVVIVDGQDVTLFCD